MANPGLTAEFLAKEYETYKAKLPELARHEGKFPLIQGEDVIGLFATIAGAVSD